MRLKSALGMDRENMALSQEALELGTALLDLRIERETIAHSPFGPGGHLYFPCFLDARGT